MPRRRARRFFRIAPLVHPERSSEIVFLATKRHELPQAARSRLGNSSGLKRGFGLRQIHQILGHPFFLQNAPDHFIVAAGAV